MLHLQQRISSFWDLFIYFFGCFHPFCLFDSLHLQQHWTSLECQLFALKDASPYFWLHVYWLSDTATSYGRHAWLNQGGRQKRETHLRSTPTAALTHLPYYPPPTVPPPPHRGWGKRYLCSHFLWLSLHPHVLSSFHFITCGWGEPGQEKQKEGSGNREKMYKKQIQDLSHKSWVNLLNPKLVH